jgi:glycosyltransferase involved in cell wall biosynthesis
VTAKPDLVLFTAAFPFDESETVLAAELEVIAERFARIFIVPSRNGARPIDLPANAAVVDLGWTKGWSKAEKRRAVTSRSAQQILMTTFSQPTNWRSYAMRLRTYRDILAINVLKAKRVAEFVVANSLQDAIFYDYWFENSTLALALLRNSGAIRCAIARAHRFDIYDDEGSLGRVPFRDYKARHLDAIFVISEHGAAYLRKRVKQQQAKVHVSPLGIAASAVRAEPRAEPPLIVSCSSLLPRKRVHLIPTALRARNRPLRWTHFGDGPERSRVEAAAASLPSSVKWDLRGWASNADVREYYRTEGVSLFLSLSESEGIPVSMMEAESAGIPIVASAVGGVPELVTSKTGLVLKPDASADEVANAITEALAPTRFDPVEIRSSFASRFEASTSYTAFADAVLSIWEAV